MPLQEQPLPQIPTASPGHVFPQPCPVIIPRLKRPISPPVSGSWKLGSSPFSSSLQTFSAFSICTYSMNFFRFACSRDTPGKHTTHSVNTPMGRKKPPEEYPHSGDPRQPVRIMVQHPLEARALIHSQVPETIFSTRQILSSRVWHKSTWNVVLPTHSSRLGIAGPSQGSHPLPTPQRSAKAHFLFTNTMREGTRCTCLWHRCITSIKAFVNHAARSWLWKVQCQPPTKQHQWRHSTLGSVSHCSIASSLVNHFEAVSSVCLLNLKYSRKINVLKHRLLLYGVMGMAVALSAVKFCFILGVIFCLWPET